jgi:hypothetical protein
MLANFNMAELINILTTTVPMLMAFGGALYKLIRMHANHEAMHDKQQEFLNKQQQSLVDIKLDIMRLQCINETLPVTTRARIYEEYKRLGGNHWLDLYYKKHLQPLLEKEVK